MKPLQDLETMEELLLEYSICHYYEEHKFLYPKELELHVEWIRVRTINDFQFNNLEQEYVKLASLLDKAPKIYNQMSVSPRENFVLEKIFQMSFVPTKVSVWPSGYDQMDSVVDSSDLEERIEHLFEKRTEKQLV